MNSKNDLYVNFKYLLSAEVQDDESQLVYTTKVQDDESQLVYTTKVQDNKTIEVIVDVINPIINLEKHSLANIPSPPPQPTQAPVLLASSVEKLELFKPKSIIGYMTDEILNKTLFFMDDGAITVEKKIELPELLLNTNVLEATQENQPKKEEGFYDDSIFGIKLLSFGVFMIGALSLAYRSYIRYPQEERIYNEKCATELLDKVNKILANLSKTPLKPTALADAFNQAKDLIEMRGKDFPSGSKKALELFTEAFSQNVKHIKSHSDNSLTITKSFNICKAILEQVVFSLHSSTGKLVIAEMSGPEELPNKLLPILSIANILPYLTDVAKIINDNPGTVENCQSVVITLNTASNLVVEHSASIKAALYGGVTFLGVSLFDYFYGNSQEDSL